MTFEIYQLALVKESGGKSPVQRGHDRLKVGVYFMKIFIGLLLCLFLLSACASSGEKTAQHTSDGIVAKPESEELRPGEKLNMMLMMDIENRAYEMDEVIVIPPKVKTKATHETGPVHGIEEELVAPPE